MPLPGSKILVIEFVPFTMCKGTVHTTRGCLKLLNLKIQYLQKEVEVQSRIIKQWKALYESSQVKPTQECHVNCKIDHLQLHR